MSFSRAFYAILIAGALAFCLRGAYTERIAGDAFWAQAPGAASPNYISAMAGDNFRRAGAGFFVVNKRTGVGRAYFPIGLRYKAFFRSVERDRLPPAGVEIHIDESLSDFPEYVTLAIDNNDRSDGIKFGPDYYIQAKLGSIWVDVPLELNHSVPLFWLYKGESTTLNAYLYPEQYSYRAGTYRIVKPIGNSAISSGSDLFAEFEIL
ncbi:MAG: hypothetical protein LBL49_00325 [Clostridiales Family XIII bacterium]|jgi:hypothetical protein|nr:hypothetical protein [Clostridiales Family XIII bacterium]